MNICSASVLQMILSFWSGLMLSGIFTIWFFIFYESKDDKNRRLYNEEWERLNPIINWKTGEPEK